MSMILTRPPLESIGMNGAGTQKRRSARLSHEANGENEPPSKKPRTNTTAVATSTSTKQQDGGNATKSSKAKKVYEQEVEGFSFSKGKRKRAVKETVPAQTADTQSANVRKESASTKDAVQTVAGPDTALQTATKKTRRVLPATPERDVAQKTTRRSKRLSNEQTAEPVNLPPIRLSPRQPLPNVARSPSPAAQRPVTLEKTRKQGANGVEEEKVMRIMLPFADTPIIRRNREMRKGSADGRRRSSSGLRGRRASSLIDEGRGHALPHSEVPTSEFFKHISADLTEPRRMRCLLGWCGTRSLPPEADPPPQNTTNEGVDSRARRIARTIQEELAADLVTRGSLSDWFSRDESNPPQVPPRKKPNPRNTANAAKAEELTRELEKLLQERKEWDAVVASAQKSDAPENAAHDRDGNLSPLRPVLLDSSQREIFEQLQTATQGDAVNSATIQEKLRHISEDLEFVVDRFAHGVHALKITRDTAERVADSSLANAAQVLEEREKQRTANGRPINQMDALRGLARVLNAKYR